MTLHPRANQARGSDVACGPSRPRVFALLRPRRGEGSQDDAADHYSHCHGADTARTRREMVPLRRRFTIAAGASPGVRAYLRARALGSCSSRATEPRADSGSLASAAFMDPEDRVDAPQSDASRAEQGAAMRAQQPNGSAADADGCGEGVGNLFVGDLSRGITEEDLVRAFSAFGEVVEASIKRDRYSQRNLGYGFVQMATKAQAKEALEHMHGTELAGRQIRINWAQRTARLFAGGLPSSITHQQLIELFKAYGPLSEEDIVIRDAKNGSGKFAFVKFQERQHAEDARRELQNGCEAFPSLRLDWHHGNKSSGQYQHYIRQRDLLPSSVMLSDYSVYIHFEVEDPSVEVTEDLLRTTFSRFGPIATTAVKARHISEETGRVKGYGFVHFAGTAHGRQAATTAVQTVTGISLDGVRFQADFSNSTKRQAAGVLTAQHAGIHPVTATGLQMEYMIPSYDGTSGMVFPSFPLYSTVSPPPNSAALEAHLSTSSAHGSYPVIGYYPYIPEQIHAAHPPMYMPPQQSPENFGGRGRGRMARDRFRPQEDEA